MYQMTFTPEYIATIHARVQKGIEFLVKKKGPRWFDAITLPTLKLDNPSMCVLGQTFRAEANGSRNSSAGFYYAVDKYRLKNGGINYGFNIEDEPWHDLPAGHRKNANNPWTLLGELWISEIRKARRKAGKKKD